MTMQEEVLARAVEELRACLADCVSNMKRIVGCDVHELLHADSCNNSRCWKSERCNLIFHGMKVLRDTKPENLRAGEQPQPRTRRDRRKCAYFRSKTAVALQDWCAKYGPHYKCLGAHGCKDYKEGDTEEA